jgi:hypothetical protein
MKSGIFFSLLLLIGLKSDFINGEYKEYASIDDPVCTSDCSSIYDSNKKLECFEKQLNFHNYKLVKSLFNYGKAAIYAGLWYNRYVSMCDLSFDFRLKFFLIFLGKT